MRFLAILIGSTVVLNGCAVHKTYWVNPESTDKPLAGAKGIYYALPETTVDIDLIIAQITYNRGKLADALLKSTEKEQYLRRLDIDEAKIPATGAPIHTYKINSFAMNIGARPDPENVYFVELPSGVNKDTNLSMELTELGIFGKIESEIADRTLDNLGQILQSAAGAAAKYAAFAGDQTEDDQIALIVTEVEAIRKKRTGLLSEPLVSDPVVFERQLLELTKRESQLVGNFLGIRTSLWTARFQLIPASDWPDTYELLKVAEAGPTAGLSLVNAAPIHNPPSDWMGCGGQPVILHIVRGDRGRTLAGTVSKASGVLDRRVVRGLYYRIPEPASFALSYQNEVKTQAVALVAQFGELAALPGSLNAVSSKLTASLYPATGALRSVGSQSKSIQPETIARFGAAAESLAEAANSRRRAQRADELAEAAELRANLEIANTLLTGALAGAAPSP